ncbi:MAG: ABC transporter substrate-binding protein [Betaproteobacteria bacterium]
MIRTCRRLLVVGMTVAFAVTAACGRAPATGRAPVRISVGGQNQLLYLPTTLAQQLGFYRDEGLDVTIEDFAGGSKALEALVGGSADVVSGFYDHTIQMAAEGRELVAFVTMLRYPGLVLASPPAALGGVSRIEDLKGRIAGVTAAGSSTQMMLTYLLQKHGVPPDGVAVTAIGVSATAIAAMEHGSVAAGMMAEPAFTLAQQRHADLRILADLRTGDGVKAAFGTSMYPGAVLYSTGDWIRGHRYTAAGLARAVRRTLEWMQAHTPAEIAAKMPESFRGGDDALYIAALGHAMPMYSPDGVMSADGAEIVHRLLAESMASVRNAKIDLTKTYTNELLKR